MRRFLSWLAAFFDDADYVPVPRLDVRPALGICLDCDSVQELSVHGTCGTCGSSSVIRRGAARELEARVQRRRVDRVIQERRARRERMRFRVERSA